MNCLILTFVLFFCAVSAVEVEPTIEPMAEGCAFKPIPELYVLALVVPKRNASELKDPTIHGLWPQFKRINNSPKVAQDCGPTNCGCSKTYRSLTASKNDIGTMYTNLLKKWVNYLTKKPDDFWEHEWEKHGRCVFNRTTYRAGIPQNDYFELALKLFDDNIDNVKQGLKGIKPKGATEGTSKGKTKGTTKSTPKSTTLKQLKLDLKNALKFTPELQCVKKENKMILEEIRLCFNYGATTNNFKNVLCDCNRNLGPVLRAVCGDDDTEIWYP